MRTIVYDAMTVAEEEKLRAIEDGVLEHLQSAGLTERHHWAIEVREGVRYIILGRERALVAISAKRVLEMTAGELLDIVRKAI